MRSITGVSLAAARLKHASPREFEEFVKALVTYSSEVTVAVTMAAASDILCAQGNAQMARKLLQTLAECDSPTQ